MNSAMHLGKQSSHGYFIQVFNMRDDGLIGDNYLTVKLLLVDLESLWGEISELAIVWYQA